MSGNPRKKKPILNSNPRCLDLKPFVNGTNSLRMGLNRSGNGPTVRLPGRLTRGLTAEFVIGRANDDLEGISRAADLR